MRDHTLQLGNGASQRRLQLGRARRGHDAAALSRDQRIGQGNAQLGQAVADRRGRDVQALCRARHAALGQHGVEHEQQVEIERR